MDESRIELTDRLRLEGRWTEASLFRDEARRRLRADGMSRKDAGEAAWVAMAEKFPPLPEPTVELVPKSVFEGKPAIPIEDVVRWVLETYYLVDIRPEDAPSSAAWSMRCWATSGKRSERIFFRHIVSKFLASRGVAARDDDDVDAYKRMMGFLDEDGPGGSRRLGEHSVFPKTLHDAVQGIGAFIERIDLYYQDVESTFVAIVTGGASALMYNLKQVGISAYPTPRFRSYSKISSGLVSGLSWSTSRVRP